jgi:hypothetical protein
MSVDFHVGHERDLRDFFSGALEGDMGICSPHGAAIDHAPPRGHLGRPREDEERKRLPDGTMAAGYLPVGMVHVQHGAPYYASQCTEAHPGALAAARVYARVQATLARMPVRDVRVLREFYRTITRYHPPGFPHGLLELGDLRAVAAVLEGTDHLRVVVRRSKDKSLNGARTVATRDVRAVRQRARQAVEDAQAAYAEAAVEQRQSRRDERRESRILQSLEQGPPLPGFAPGRVGPAVSRSS